MTPRTCAKILLIGLVLLASTIFPTSAVAQGPLPDAPGPVAPATRPAMAFVARSSPVSYEHHKYWDKTNVALFAANGAMSFADFWVTRQNLQSGGKEMNPVVRIFGRSTAGLIANFAGEDVGVLGVSYLFHKTGHHKMERAVSAVNLSMSSFAVSYGLAHR